MNKRILHISIIMLIVIFLNLTLFSGNANAESIAGINCPSSVNLNQDFTVSLILQSNAYAAEANISIKYSDGSESTGRIVYVKGMEDFPNSASFKAKAEGKATVSVTNIIISDSNSATLENGGSKTQELNVVNPSATTTTTTPNTSTTSAKYTDVNETVYTTERCNIRESDSTTSNKIATVNKDTKLTRKGVGDNGWSKIEYNGKTCYISTQYLTKDTPPDPEFKAVEETMYAIQSCNLRASWSTDSEKVGYLTEGQEVTRVGVAENGWSKIKYNGKEVYIATRLLQKDPIENTNNTVNNTNETNVANIDNTIANDTNVVTNTNVVNVNSVTGEIGVLPEVGNNVAVYIFATIAISLLAIAGYSAYYINKKL